MVTGLRSGLRIELGAATRQQAKPFCRVDRGCPRPVVWLKPNRRSKERRFPIPKSVSAQPPSREVGTTTGVLPFVEATVVEVFVSTTWPAHSANAAPPLTATANSTNRPKAIDLIGSLPLCLPATT